MLKYLFDSVIIFPRYKDTQVFCLSVTAEMNVSSDKVSDILGIVQKISDVLCERSQDLAELLGKVTRVEHMLEQYIDTKVYCVRCRCKGHMLNECPVLDTSQNSSDASLASQGSAPGSDTLRGCAQEYDLWATDGEEGPEGEFIDVVDIPKELEERIAEKRREAKKRRLSL